MKFKIIAAAGLFLVLIAVGCRPAAETPRTPVESAPPAAVEGIKIGNLAPDFQLQSLEGKTVSLSDFRGKPVLINFWATWCPPCKAEMPYLQQVYDEWTGKGLVLLEIDIAESATTVSKFMKENNLSMPVLLDTNTAVTNKYGVVPIPTTFLIDKDGIIRGKVVGAFPNKAAIERFIARVMP